jgi:hypothetical protein
MACEPKKDIEMAAKRRKAEEIVKKLRQVDVLNAQGRSMAADPHLDGSRFEFHQGVPQLCSS